ncbi:hypothetical protein BH23BAC1_BH23BAC1_12210 [soil metagenome]
MLLFQFYFYWYVYFIIIHFKDFNYSVLSGKDNDPHCGINF